MVDEMRENRLAHAKRQEAGEDGCHVGKQGRCHKHLAGTLADVGDCRNYKSHDNEWDDETEKLAEEGVESNKQPYHKFRHHKSGGYAEHNGYDDFRQQPDFPFFHNHRGFRYRIQK